MSFVSEAAPDTQLLKKLDLERALFSDEYEQFDLDGQKIIYVLQENTTAITLGVAVMVAESGTPVIGQYGLRPLATQLNKLGWVTILMPAPDIAFTPTKPESLNTDTSQPNEPTGDEVAQPAVSMNEMAEVLPSINLSKSAKSQLNSATFLQHEKELIALLQKSAEKAADYPGFFLVIAQGTSAAWMTKIYSEKKLDTPDALVAISPFWPDKKLNDSLPSLMANTPMPVLDLYNENDNDWSLQSIELRRISVTKALKMQYRQREIMGYTFTEQSSLNLSKEIYGWTTYMGW